MLRQLGSLVGQLQAPALQGCIQQLERRGESLLRGFAFRAVQGQEVSLDAASSSLESQLPSQQQHGSAPASSSATAALVSHASGGAQLQHTRSMSYMYARKPEGRSDVYHAHSKEFGHVHLAEYLIKTVPKFITMAVMGPAQSSVHYQEATIYTTPENLVPLCYFLRDHVNTQMKCLIDVTAVDFPERGARFEVVYHLLSPRWNNRIRIKVMVDELTPVPTVVSVWNAANWFEREVWDMFGVFFSGHPDLRRILTDYGFTGHPMRKDFPLSGYTEVRYDYGKKRVISEPLELTQEFRYFDFSSPWDTLPR